MKAAADTYFLQGSNQLVGHGWPYTAEGVDYPGWRFYASASFDERNPWWIVMPDVASYLQRTSFLLRQGNPANDVALYLANDDAWATFEPGQVEMSAKVSGRLGPDIIRAILDSGHNFDGFDDELLALRGRVDGANLAFGDLRYPVVVLAGVERMPLATLRALDAFARGGGILIATRRLPAIVPGFTATEADQGELRQIVRGLFIGPGAPAIFLPDEQDFAPELNKRLAPDVGFLSAAPDVGIVHRSTADAQIYFLANTGAAPVHAQAAFRVAGLQPEWWDLMDGKVGAASILSQTGQATTVEVDLPAFGSRALVFSSRRLPPAAAQVPSDPAPAPLDLSTGWTVTFGPGSKPVAMERLRSWTEDEATLGFSGVATYEKTITVPDGMLRPGQGLVLDFGKARAGRDRGARQAAAGAPAGQPPGAGGRARRGGPAGGAFENFEAPVREAAVVYVNGTRAGSVWHPPYALDVTGLLRNGENSIRIEVANLAINFMAAHPLPDYTALNARYGERFLYQEPGMVVTQPAGLLGPLTLEARPAP
jgi:hypothetical protein